MNARAAFKIAVVAFVLLLGLGAVALVCTWAYRKFHLGRDQMPGQVINDSLKVYGEKAVMHFDSSQFYYRKYETLTQHSDSVNTDSAAFADLVAQYRANLRAVITSQILDSIARQRGEIRVIETPHVHPGKELHIYYPGEHRPKK